MNARPENLPLKQGMCIFPGGSFPLNGVCMDRLGINDDLTIGMIPFQQQKKAAFTGKWRSESRVVNGRKQTFPGKTL